ncbi:MAG: hypothetical protein ABIE70_00455 [bacterium]
MVSQKWLVMIVSIELLLYSLASGALWLVLVALVHRKVARWARIDREVPRELIDDSGMAGMAVQFFMELVFLVVIPTMAYALFSMILPLTGLRTGLAVGLIAFTLGAAPCIIGLAMQLRFSLLYLTYFLAGMLLKILGTLGIIAYLYSL